ncbi:MAG: DinB family protein [Cyclobacteriaceae bacterium]|nr:DinB family protein [Cyclobacteriaceae bacterium]
MDPLAGIIKSIQDTYDGEPWHGPSIKKILSEIPAEKCDSRIGGGHSIIELVLHITAWRGFVVRQLQGNQDFDITDEANFPNGKDWHQAIEELDKSQGQLLKAIASFDKQKLQDFVPSRKYSFSKLLHGITHHDLYHLGQIVMITKQF